jgi:hypothetical protein
VSENLEGGDHGQFEGLARHLSGESEETSKNLIKESGSQP